MCPLGGWVLRSETESREVLNCRIVLANRDFGEGPVNVWPNIKRVWRRPGERNDVNSSTQIFWKALRCLGNVLLCHHGLSLTWAKKKYWEEKILGSDHSRLFGADHQTKDQGGSYNSNEARGGVWADGQSFCTAPRHRWAVLWCCLIAACEGRGGAGVEISWDDFF